MATPPPTDHCKSVPGAGSGSTATRPASGPRGGPATRKSAGGSGAGRQLRDVLIVVVLIIAVLVLFSFRGNVGKFRRGGRWRRMWDSAPVSKPVSRCLVGDRDESWSLIFAEHEEEQQEEEQIQIRHDERTRGQRRAQHHLTTRLQRCS